jgi:hypothetical protein
MPTSTRQQFIVSQQVIPALINGLINGAIAWAMHRHTLELGLWDRGAYAVDLLATGFLLPAISWLIIRPLLQRQAAAGKAPLLAGLPRPWLLRWMHPTLWGGTAMIGLMGMLLVGGGVVLALQWAGSPDFAGTGYAAFKTAFGALVTLLLQPVMVFAALADHQGGDVA